MCVDLASALVELGLEAIDEEQPKIPKMEKRALLLLEHLFEVSASNILKGTTELVLMGMETAKQDGKEGESKVMKRKGENLFGSLKRKQVCC